MPGTEENARHRGRAVMSHRFLCLTIALASMLAASVLLHALFPPTIPQGVATKLDYFTRHKDEFDTLFLGTSRIYYAVSPQVFDATTSDNGVSTRTFNFGIDALHPPENFYVLDQILKTRPQRLKWVFLELGDIQTTLYQTLGTERSVYWHDWPRTKLTLHKAFDPHGNSPWFLKAARLWLDRREFAGHLSLFARRFANVGRADAFWGLKTDSGTESDSELGPRHDGYRLAGVAMSAQNTARYQRKLANQVAEARPTWIDPYADQAYREYAQKIREIGAIPVFVVPPVISQSPIRFQNPPPQARLLAFNDSKTYPMLFDPKVRVDDAHLTREGAEEFTRLLALEFLRGAHQP
jgi:hypothetical protein